MSLVSNRPSKFMKWARSHQRTKLELLLFLLRTYPDEPVPVPQNSFTRFIFPDGLYTYSHFPTKQALYFNIINCILLFSSVCSHSRSHSFSLSLTHSTRCLL